MRVAFQEGSAWPPARLYAEDVAPALTRTELILKRGGYMTSVRMNFLRAKSVIEVEVIL